MVDEVVELVGLVAETAVELAVDLATEPESDKDDRRARFGCLWALIVIAVGGGFGWWFW